MYSTFNTNKIFDIKDADINHVRLKQFESVLI